MAFQAAKAAESGPGTYRFLVAQSVLHCDEDRHDDDAFAESVEQLEAICQPLIAAEQAWYRKALLKSVVDEKGNPMYRLANEGQKDEELVAVKPGAEIPAKSLRRKMGLLVQLAVANGVLGSKKNDVEDATSFFRDVMKKSDKRAAKRAKEKAAEAEPE